jgi:hypothetical protein
MTDSRRLTNHSRQQADEWGVPFGECSAKTGEGVIAAFDLLVNCMMMSYWMDVADMGTPAHVPSDALIDELPDSSSTAPDTIKQRRCLLQ